MQTILIVDDEPEIVRITRGYLESAGFRVLSAGNGAAALATFRQEKPDLLILDLNLPSQPGGTPLDGLDVARAIRQTPGSAGQTPIIILTARVDETDRIIGLELGADDYVVKPFSPRELLARVRAVLRRTSPVVTTSEIIEAGQLVIDIPRHEVTVAGDLVDLTPTEFTLLQTMAAEPGRVFTREQLVTLIDPAYAGLERTVDSHIKNLRTKIEPEPRQPQFVLTVFGVGYKFNDDL